MSRLFTRPLAKAALAVSLTLPGLASGAIAVVPGPAKVTAAAKVRSPKELYEHTLKGTGWIVAPLGGNQARFGTGWIFDRDQRLMVTNQHVIEGKEQVLVYFPAKVEGKVQKERGHYLDKVTPVKAVVLLSDFDRDLAIIQLDSLPAEAQALPLAKQSAEEGDELRSVAGLSKGNEGLWGYSHGEVRLVTRRPLSERQTPVMTVVSDIPTNGGNSGGAVVNSKGEVVAVVQGGYSGDVRGVSTLVDLSELQAFLATALPLVTPGGAEEFYQRGLRHASAGRLDAASDDFSSALKHNPKHVNSLVERGWQFYLKKDYQTAISDFSDALQLEPSHTVGLRSRAIALRSLGKYAEALADHTKSIRQEPRFALNYYERGLTQHDAEKLDEALDDFQRALALDNRPANFHAGKGKVLLALDRTTEAEKDFRAALERTPGNAEYLNELGVCLFRQEKYQPAAESFGAAVDRDPNVPMHFANFADACRMIGKADVGVKFITHGIDRHTGKASAEDLAHLHYSRGLCWMALKQHQTAAADFSLAIQHKKDAEYFSERAKAFTALGLNDNAAEDRRKAAELNPHASSQEPAVEPVPAPVENVRPQPQPPQDAKTENTLHGTWRYIGTINGVQVRIAFKLKADGTYVGYTHLTQRCGTVQESEDNGTWQIRNGLLVMKNKAGGTVERRFTLKGDRVEVIFSELGNLALTFERFKQS